MEYKKCPVCMSMYTLYTQDVLGKRTSKMYPQRFCMDCHSFFHNTGYKETSEQKAFDFEMLFSNRENHRAIQGQLLLELITKLSGIKNVLEIGHGIGLFLKSCEDYGLDAHGFELNEECHRFAREELQVSSELGLFGQEHERTYDLITAIHVFEHLERPRDLFEVMRDHLNPDGAIYISVPFVERSQWKYLWQAGKPASSNPHDVFDDNDVHITHFSINGMRNMGVSLGAKSSEYFVSKDVYHHSPGAYQGVLFRF
jgi:SAM-dependent methyltransferase